MKQLVLFSWCFITLSSCDKIEEKISSVVSETTEKAQQKTKEAIQETVTEQLGKLVNSENIPVSYTHLDVYKRQCNYWCHLREKDNINSYPK